MMLRLEIDMQILKFTQKYKVNYSQGNLEEVQSWRTDITAEQDHPRDEVREALGRGPASWPAK